MNNLQLFVTFFFECFVWFLGFLLLWILYFKIRNFIIKKYAKKYKCPKGGCLGCKHLDLAFGLKDGVVWECRLGRYIENPFRQ